MGSSKSYLLTQSFLINYSTVAVNNYFSLLIQLKVWKSQQKVNVSMLVVFIVSQPKKRTMYINAQF